MIRALRSFRSYLALVTFLALPLGAQSPWAGTYRFMICPTTCDMRDPSRARIVGDLVVADRPISVSELPEDIRRYFRFRRIFTLPSGPSGSDDPNACVVWAETKWRESVYAGVEFTSLTHWDLEASDSIRVVMFQIPEGADIATLRRRGSELHGSVRSVGSGAATVPLQDMIAWRVAPPTLESCMTAARK